MQKVEIIVYTNILRSRISRIFRQPAFRILHPEGTTARIMEFNTNFLDVSNCYTYPHQSMVYFNTKYFAIDSVRVNGYEKRHIKVLYFSLD
jgi:hypothetical protein